MRDYYLAFSLGLDYLADCFYQVYTAAVHECPLVTGRANVLLLRIQEILSTGNVFGPQMN